MKDVILCDGLRVDAVACLCREYGFGIEVQSFYDPEYYTTDPDPIAYHLTATHGIRPI